MSRIEKVVIFELTNSECEYGVSNYCRNCKHIHWADTDRTPVDIESKKLSTMFIGECTKDYCFCLKFFPKDNLKYLEIIYDQKKKTTKSL